MAKEEQSNALASFAPVGAPILGVVLAIVFIVAIVMTSSISENRDALQKTVTTVSTRMGSTDVEAPEWGEIPDANTVTVALNPAPENTWKPSAATPLLKLPVKWIVELEAPPQDIFQQYDRNGDGFWDKNEFASTPYATGADKDLANFDNWDRNPEDGRISESEHNDPPRSDVTVFEEELDTNPKDGYLTAPDEITQAEVDKWDRHPYDGKISLEEYRRRFEPREERDLGAVSNVRVAVDPATMEIVVTWDEPQVQDMPADIVYYVERFAPQTKAERESEYRRRMAKYLEEWRPWNDRFQAWWRGSTEDGKTRRSLFPREDEAKKKYVEETGDNPPQEPAKPEDWEVVTETAGELVSGTEFRDRSFDLEVTYTYAVRMLTKAPPKKGQASNEKLIPDYYAYPERTVQEGHPVLVRNRIEMRWKSQAGANATVLLSKWHRIGEDQWYKLRISQTLEPDQTLGGNYSKATLADMDGVLIDTSGVEVGLDLLEEGNVDFSTGFTYVTNQGGKFLFTSRDLGDFELPRATAQDAAEKDDALGKDNPMEVRALTVANGGAEGVFQVTRWHQVEGQWLRVVWQASVRRNGVVGGTVDLGAPGGSVKVYDASGNEVSKRFSGQSVEMTAGTYESLDGRSIVLDGERFDLFGTLYKE